MNDLSIKQMTISSIEVAEMLEVKHADLLKKLEGTKKANGTTKQVGIIPVLTEGNFPVSDYFIEDSYKDNSGKANKCYQFTKLGCDFIANKFTGEKGIIFTAKYVKRFNEMTEYIKAQSTNKTQLQVSFDEIVKAVGIVANSLNANDASRLLMYDKLFSSYGIATEFLPKYENNGSREMKPATELLRQIGANISTVAFNKMLVEQGYLEIKSRKSTTAKSGIKFYKVLSKKGLQYGENLVHEKNQREAQPYYYADTFQKLYNIVTERSVLAWQN